jgi:hypothetical protein
VSTDVFADVLRLNDRATMEILLDDPAHVRLPVNDAEIIDRAVDLRSLFPASPRVILVSGDLSMEFRAEGAGLETRHVARDVSGDEKGQEGYPLPGLKSGRSRNHGETASNCWGRSEHARLAQRRVATEAAVYL